MSSTEAANNTPTAAPSSPKTSPTPEPSPANNSSTSTSSTAAPVSSSILPSTATNSSPTPPKPARTTIVTSTPLKSRKPRCTFKDCRTLAQPIVGDCGFCSQKYCGKHRMLESHNCAGLEDCKKVERERNRDRLEQERTVAIRGI